MKYALLILILTNTAFCDFSLTAKEAINLTDKALKSQKTQCVKDWEQEVEEQINSTIEIGECYDVFYIPACVPSNFYESTFRKLKKLGYWVRLHNENYYKISWCRK